MQSSQDTPNMCWAASDRRPGVISCVWLSESGDLVATLVDLRCPLEYLAGRRVDENKRQRIRKVSKPVRASHGVVQKNPPEAVRGKVSRVSLLARRGIGDAVEKGLRIMVPLSQMWPNCEKGLTWDHSDPTLMPNMYQVAWILQ